LILLAGDDACLTVGLLLGLRWASPPRPLLVIDGANALDPYLLADLARRTGQAPAHLLRSVVVSRLFTAHQLEVAVAERLPGELAVRHPGALLFSGLLDLLDDEDLPAAEARRIFRRLLADIVRLGDGPRPVLASMPARPRRQGREGFLPRLEAAATRILRVSTREGHLTIVNEKPPAGQWQWEPGIPLLVARRFA
jgi:hypothetical protein